MNNYFKYFTIFLIAIFSFYWTNKVIELSEKNNVILASINKYADSFDYKCREGSITEDGIILGLSGLRVDKDKSYSNMKGIGFKEELIEYKENECILSKKNNLNKYIIRGNEYNNNISIVIDVNSGKYYNKMLKIADQKNIELNILMNYNSLSENLDNIENHSNILFKGNSLKELNNFINILHDEIFCVKTNDYEIINDCIKKKINTIKIINYIDKDLLTTTKKILDKGVIIFIKESNNNLNELSATINYIQSKGYKIVNINELLF